MIRPGFLDPESRQDLIELTRDGSAAHRLSRRANALVLLDDGMSCEARDRRKFGGARASAVFSRLLSDQGWTRRLDCEAGASRG